MSPKEESERLMSALLPVAWEALRARGTFAPYAGWLTRRGELLRTDPARGASEHDQVTALTAQVRAEVGTGTVRAAALLSNVRVVPPGARQPTDAVRVLIDHADGFRVCVFLPYARSAGGELTRGLSFAAEGLAFAFPEATP